MSGYGHHWCQIGSRIDGRLQPSCGAAGLLLFCVLIATPTGGAVAQPGIRLQHAREHSSGVVPVAVFGKDDRISLLLS